MSVKLRARTAARGWVTRSCSKLTTILTSSTINLTELEDAAAEFDDRIGKLDDAEHEYEMEVEDDGKLTDCINEAADFREKSKEPRIEASKKLLALRNTPPPKAVPVSSSAKLPKLEMPTFTGDPMQWTSFHEQFKVIVDDSDMPDVQKFTYLRSVLKGEALCTIEGLSLTSAHYVTAIGLLKERFGRPERIIFAHIQDLLNMSIQKQGKVSAMWTMYNTLQCHVRSLAALGVSGKQYGVILTPLILSRMPQSLRLEWARTGEGHESDLDWLLHFLKSEIERQERSDSFNTSADDGEKRSTKPTYTQNATATALVTTMNCPLCGGGHHLDKCAQLMDLPVDSRKGKLRDLHACFKCLSSKYHSFKKCKDRCAKCQGFHHSVLCREIVQISTSESNSNSNVSTTTVHKACMSVKRMQAVLLQTKRVDVVGQTISNAVVMFDTGSDKTYISSRLVNKVQPEWVTSEQISYASFGTSQSTSPNVANVFNVSLQGSGDLVQVQATEIDVICCPVYCPTIPEHVVQSLPVGFEPLEVCSGEEVCIDILIGLDHYWKLMTSEIVTVDPDLVAQKSVFGWVLSGTIETIPPKSVSHQLACLSSFSDTSGQSFWDLESIGIKDSPEDSGLPQDDAVHQEFLQSVTHSDGRYEVALPWKSDTFRPQLLNNEKLARTRLDHLSRKLSRDPSLESRYLDVFKGYIDEGFIEEVPVSVGKLTHPVYYMPHRPVVKESSTTTKIRPVFDASAKGVNGIALNDCLETGPNLLPNLPAILMRFRRWKIGLTADITKAFLQIQICTEDRDVHRFMLQVNGELRFYRFTRVPFGNKSSPFLLNATIKHHLSQFSPSTAVNELSENLYVDDLLTGADSDHEACDLLTEANSLMEKASMVLTKWCSNSSNVGDLLSREFSNRSITVDEAPKVLGLRWISAEDCFGFDGVTVPSGLVITKRVVLSFISQLFDPLGFLTPFIMAAKCLFQSLWRVNCGWDDVVAVDIEKAFLDWIDGMALLHQWRIPRCFTGGLWRDFVSVELHGFGDASQMAYGACIYLCVEMQDGTWNSNLVFAKGKVAPLKQPTVPRLELLASLLCARLIVYIRDSLRLPSDVAYWCWTDSTVCLAWIGDDAKRWKPFVCNRVTEIQRLTKPSAWHHCPGRLNPADLITRGLTAQDLVASQVWLHGPSFLVDGNRNFDASIADDTVPSDVTEDKIGVSIVSMVSAKNVKLFEVERWGSMCKAIRVVSWVLRFVKKCQKKSISKGKVLCLEELTKAKIVLLRQIQQQDYSEELSCLLKGKSVSKKSPLVSLNPFVDDAGLLRVQGRVQLADLSYESKHPVILPKGHFSVLVVRNIHESTKHSGVESMIVTLRSQYWIIGARRICKTVKRLCVTCRRLDAQPATVPVSPLPKYRVNQAPVFSVTGLDHCGPLYCSDFGSKKFYVLLFTCAVVRAVHLELVDSLSADATVDAIRRFISRRGMPTLLMSDNARGFLAARDLLGKRYGDKAPTWRNIVPRAPWWGGYWERLVRSIKSPLRKCLGRRSVGRVELETCLFEIEACVNSRPLTFVGDDIKAKEPLTPAHFIIGRLLTSGPLDVDLEKFEETNAKELVHRREAFTSCLDSFWHSWLNEYVKTLPQLPSVNMADCCSLGEIVLIKGEGTRMKWPLGVIEKLFPGRDGIVRSAVIRTASGLLTRPIQHIYKLEVNSVCTNNISADDESTEPTQTRSGRIVIKPDRLVY